MFNEVPSLLRPYNNDRTAYFTAFRSHASEMRVRPTALAITQQQDSMGVSSAAPALRSIPPRPAQLTESEAESALQAVQQSAQPAAMAQVHSGLDANRVARLLGLLD